MQARDEQPAATILWHVLLAQAVPCRMLECFTGWAPVLCGKPAYVASDDGLVHIPLCREHLPAEVVAALLGGEGQE